MSATKSGDGADDGDAATWASETLPIAVRRELLERELKELGFRKAQAQGGSASTEPGPAKQQQAESGPSRTKVRSGDRTRRAG